MGDQPAVRDPGRVLAENALLSRREAAFYHENHFEIFHPFEQARLGRHLGRYASATSALDVGAGTGNVITKLRTPLRVAVDLSPEMLDQLGRQDPDVVRVAALLERLPLVDQSFDLVLMYSTAHHLADFSGLVELHRVLKPGGRLLIDHEEAFRSSGWRGRLYRCSIWLLGCLAVLWYWRRPAARPHLAYRSVWWPLSHSRLPDIDFALTDGGQPDPAAIERALVELGMSTRRYYYLLSPLPMVSGWQRAVDALCARGRIGHFAIEATR